MAISACSDGLVDRGGETGCRETLSGAVTAAFTCPAATSAWDSAANLGTVTIATTDSSALRVSIPFSGEPRTRSYELDAQGIVLGGVSFQEGVWFAGVVFFPSGALATYGSYTLKLTSVSVLTATSAGRTYRVHGSLDATLLQSSSDGGAGATVIVHAVF